MYPGKATVTGHPTSVEPLIFHERQFFRIPFLPPFRSSIVAENVPGKNIGRFWQIFLMANSCHGPPQSQRLQAVPDGFHQPAPRP